MACSFFLGCRVFVFTFDQSLIATTRRWSLPTGPGVVYLCPWTAPAWPGVTDEELTRNMWPQMPAIKPGCFPPSIWHVIDQCVPHCFFGLTYWQLITAIGDFFWRLLYDVHGYEIFQLGLFNSDPHAGNAGDLQDSGRMKGNGKSKEKKVERKFQTSKLDDTSWELPRSTNAHSWTSEGCKQVWR